MSTVTLTVIDGLGAQKNVAAEQAVSGTLTPHQVPEVSGLPVTRSTPMPTTQGDITATAGNAFEVVTGGTAVVAILGGSMLSGGKIINPLNASLSIFVDMVNAAATSAPGPNGTTEEVTRGGEWTAPGPLTGNVSVNTGSGDNNHAFTVVIF